MLAMGNDQLKLSLSLTVTEWASHERTEHSKSYQNPDLDSSRSQTFLSLN